MVVDQKNQRHLALSLISTSSPQVVSSAARLDRCLRGHATYGFHVARGGPELGGVSGIVVARTLEARPVELSSWLITPTPACLTRLNTADPKPASARFSPFKQVRRLLVHVKRACRNFTSIFGPAWLCPIVSVKVLRFRSIIDAAYTLKQLG